MTLWRFWSTQLLGQIVHHVTNQLTMMGIFYQMEVSMVSRKLIKAEAKSVGSTPLWNVHDWELRN